MSSSGPLAGAPTGASVSCSRGDVLISVGLGLTTSTGLTGAGLGSGGEIGTAGAITSAVASSGLAETVGGSGAIGKGEGLTIVGIVGVTAGLTGVGIVGDEAWGLVVIALRLANHSSRNEFLGAGAAEDAGTPKGLGLGVDVPSELAGVKGGLPGPLARPS